MSGNPKIGVLKRAQPGFMNRNNGGPICQECGLRTEDYYNDRITKNKIATFRVHCVACHENHVRRETRENI